MWITLSGIDGTGKNALKDRLEVYYGEKGYSIFNFKVPYHTWVKEMINLSGGGRSHGDPLTDELIFAASHRIESPMITTWKKKYDILISKRFWLDQFPYAEVKGLKWEEIREITKTYELEKPDLMFFLDCDAECALERKNVYPHKYKYIEFIRPLRINFLRVMDLLKDKKLPELDNIPYFLIDAHKSLERVYEEIRDIIDSYIIEHNLQPKIIKEEK
ncbi:hypothetical protein J4436_03515 [Candidatus Woesearchaeota archaeon]|nr:hypothetical protein [Candidatus Woesearchaeota archaeon]